MKGKNKIIMDIAKIAICFIILFPFFSTNAQNQAKVDSSIYKIYPWIDIPISATGFVTNMIGIKMVKNKPSISLDEIAKLDPSGINFLDKRAIHQNYDFHETAHNLSDYGLNFTVALPLLLLFDKKIKSDWYKVLLLYAEAHVK